MNIENPIEILEQYTALVKAMGMPAEDNPAASKRLLQPAVRFELYLLAELCMKTEYYQYITDRAGSISKQIPGEGFARVENIWNSFLARQDRFPDRGTGELVRYIPALQNEVAEYLSNYTKQAA